MHQRNNGPKVSDQYRPSQPHVSLFVQCGEKVLRDQLFLVEQSSEIKSALRKVSSAFPFVRNEGILYLMGVLRDLSDNSLDVVTILENNNVTTDGNIEDKKKVGSKKVGIDGGIAGQATTFSSSSISVAPLDTMTRISHHPLNGRGMDEDPLREKRWYLASDKVLGSMNLVSCIFHRIIPRRDLLLALIGAGGGVGGGSPLEPILPHEAALMWCPAYKPSALLALHNKLASASIIPSQKRAASTDQGGVDRRDRAGSGSPERVTETAPGGVDVDSNNANYVKAGGGLLREVVSSLKIAAAGIRRKVRDANDDDDDEDSYVNGGDASPFQEDDCDMLDACLKEVSRRLDDGIHHLSRTNNHHNNNGDTSSPDPSRDHQTPAHAPLSTPSVNTLLESAVRESIGKGYLLASLALGHNGPPADSLPASANGGGAAAATAGGAGGGDTAVVALSGSTSTSELEAALRVIQGLCIFVPSQKANVADSPFIPYVIETCVCCLQHIQQLSLVERRTRCASGKLTDLLVRFSVLAAKEQQQGANNGAYPLFESSPLGDAGENDDKSTAASSPPPPHRPVQSMRLDSIAVMCAMVDALEAVCHYSPPAVGQLVQMGGVKHLMNLAACPYTPPVLRCSILDTMSLLLQQGDPYRRAVLGQQAAAVAANSNIKAASTPGSPGMNGGSADKALSEGIAMQQSIVMETPVMVSPPIGAATHVGLASIPTDYPSLRAKGITVPTLPPTQQHYHHEAQPRLNVPPPITSVVGTTAPEHYRMDRATASKLDSALRTWLANHQMFGTTASALLRLRDISSGCGLGDLKAGVPSSSLHEGGTTSSSSFSTGNVAAYFSAIVRPSTSSVSSSAMTLSASSSTASRIPQQQQAGRHQGRLLQREITSLSSEREQAYLSLLEELNTKLVCCLSL